jgi:DNA-binding transcriptional MerR regulator
MEKEIDSLDNRLLQIGELAKRTGVSIRTVRYYEERNLLKPNSMTSGGLRLYCAKELNRLILIRRLITLGLNIDEIKLSLGVDLQSSSRQIRVERTLELLRLQKDKLEEEISRLSDIQKEVNESLKLVTRCIDCSAQSCPPTCPNVSRLI